MSNKIVPIQDGEFKKVRAFVVTGTFEKSGKWIIEGVASTLNPDLDGEQMSKTAIEQMVSQIRNNPIPLRSEHSDKWEDQLGKVYDASFDGRNMTMKAEIFQTTKGRDLKEAIEKGSQLGLSVAGKIKNAGYEMCESLGKRIKTFKDVIIKEISVTAKPSNTMTWLALLAKSYNFKGDNMDEVLETEATDVEATAETAEVTEITEPVTEEVAAEEVEKSVEESEEAVEVAAPTTEEAPAEATIDEVSTVEEVVDATEEDTAVEKSGRKISVKTKEELSGVISRLQEILSEEETVGKSIGSMIDDSLKKSVSTALADRDAKIEVLEKRLAQLESQPLARKGFAVKKSFTGEAEAKPEVDESTLTLQEGYVYKNYGAQALADFRKAK